MDNEVQRRPAMSPRYKAAGRWRWDGRHSASNQPQNCPRRGRCRKWLIAGAVGAFLVIAAIGNACTSSPSGTAAAPTAHETQTPSQTTTSTPAPSPSPSPTTALTAPPTAAPAPPTAAPAPPPPACKAQAPGNPYGYDFCPGNLVYSPPRDICSYFNCIPSFWNQTNGYLVECQDGTYSHSGGVRGACSYHGGQLRPVYSH